MKAAVLRKPGPVDTGPLEIRDVPLPEPGAGEVRVRVHACGICRTDLHVIEGELPPRKQDIIPGHQVVGVIDKLGPNAARYPLGTRVGVAWLHKTCGVCGFCRSGRENLCDSAAFTGYTVDGGYAEYAIAEEQFVYPLPAGFGDLEAAPLLCAGIIGFRCLKKAGLHPGDRLGIYGFGAAGHVCIQVANFLGVRVLVSTREHKHRQLAAQLGAVWTGGAREIPPEPLDAAIIFAPAGELVPLALAALNKGGRLVLGGIHMSDLPSFPYRLLYHERSLSSVANNTRDDGLEFIAMAAKIPVQTQVQTFPLEQANAALQALKHDGIQGAGVLVVASSAARAGSNRPEAR
jgi:propanol-preferring alcohol dehydrogenase